MSPRPRLTSRAPMRSVAAKNTPTRSQREQALTNSIAATAARKAGVREVDWDAVIERHKAWTADRYESEEDDE